MTWHTSDIVRVVSELNTSDKGLSANEAASRLKQHGPNELEEKKKRSPWVMFLLQFKDFMIIILIVAAIISGVVGDAKDTIVILVIVLLNAIVGFVQEYRAEKAMEALKKMSTTQASVLRDGEEHQVPARELVPGDIISLEAGDMVPADARIIESNALKVEEASLTGESQPIDKNSNPLPDEKLPIGDRTNMAYKSTLVTYGRGKAVVVATGMKTEIGDIAQMLQEDSGLTPLQLRLADFGKKLSFIVLGICVLLYVIVLLRGENSVSMLLTAISLAVAAIPEALPAVVTIALARGANIMVKKNALIRKLPAVETLGSVTYICTDKTGTLTQNKMSVKETWAAEGEQEKTEVDNLTSIQLLHLAMALNQDTKMDGDKTIGDPTEIALIEYVNEKNDFDESELKKYQRVHEMPFDSDRKMMTTIHQLGDRYLAVTKGAVESIVQICQGCNADAITRQSEKMAKAGQRVLAFSYKIIQELPNENCPEEIETDQRFVGLAGMIDPPREEAAQAVSECKGAGIVPVMITGDHPATARAVAHEMGILYGEDDKVMTGTELEGMDEASFVNEIEHIKVYARVSPEQKLNIVKTLQEKNQYVAMTGDGVNDAPALKRANIGVAMGITGTDVSKEAANMILLDDNFATIVKAIKEGRRIFDNIRRFIRYVLTCNLAEILTIFIAPIVGLPIPLLPIHILWINLVTDSLPGLAMAGEPAGRNVMKRPPRNPSESIFAGGLGIHILWVGTLMAALTLGTQAWAVSAGVKHWQTIVFTVLCFAQLSHALATHSDERLLFSKNFFSNPQLLGAVGITFALQLTVTYTPAIAKVLSIQPLTLSELLVCIGVSAIIFLAVELEKYIKSKRWKK
jgi:plasma-membrane calcium-translocating P-type ATPase